MSTVNGRNISDSAEKHC